MVMLAFWEDPFGAVDSTLSSMSFQQAGIDMRQVNIPYLFKQKAFEDASSESCQCHATVGTQG
jgi:hypothetical protein